MILLLLLHYNTVHFNNLFLHRFRKSHCAQPSSGQEVANSALIKIFKRMKISVQKRMSAKNCKFGQKAEVAGQKRELCSATFARKMKFSQVTVKCTSLHAIVCVIELEVERKGLTWRLLTLLR